MTSSVSAAASAAAGTTPVQTKAPDSLGQDAFLKLLVAQLQNQDPLKPMDGMNFVTQLAQFSELEALLGMRSDIQDLVELASMPIDPPNEGAAASTQES